MTKNKFKNYHLEQKQHFSLRKLNTGLASMMLGMTIYLLSTNNTQVVKADVIPNDQQETQLVTKKDATASNLHAESKSTTEESDKEQTTNIIHDNISHATSEQNSVNSQNDSTNIANHTDVINDQNNINSTKDPIDENKSDGLINVSVNNNQNDDKHTNQTPKSDTKVHITKTIINGLTGEYDSKTDTLTISGTTTLTKKMPLFGFADQYAATIKHLIIKDKIVLQNDATDSLFENLLSLVDITGMSNLDTSQATTMDLMFCGCAALKQLDLSSLNTKNVENMDAMFGSCSSLTSLDLSNFDTEKVNSMSSMFSQCSSLTSLNLSNVNTSNVRYMSNMFQNCKSLANLDLSGFDTQQVEYMTSMFKDCSSLTNLNLSSFITEQVQMMEYMFENCSSLTKLDLSNFNTKQVKAMQYMFNNCSSLTSLNVSSFDTQNISGMEHMFNNCAALTHLDVSNFHTENVYDMEYMFANCKSLTNLDLSKFNTKQVGLMSNMFSGCSSLTSLDLSNFDTKQVHYMDSMFDNCINLNILKLGTETTLEPNVSLNTSGYWFKQGTGTLDNPEDQQGQTSADLIANYKPGKNTNTYLRGYKYQVYFYDKDNNNQKLLTDSPVYVLALLNQYPVGTNIGNGLIVKSTPKIAKIIQDFENQNYQVNTNPLNVGFTPASENDIINIYFAHKIKNETETKTRIRTIHYQNKNGKILAPDTVQKKQFKRIKTKDLVTNKEQYSDWTTDNEQMAEVKVPVIKGYITDKAAISSQSITIDQDIELVQTYQKLGKIVPIDDKGNIIVNVPTPTYANDPNDPTKIKDDQTVPNLNGYKPIKSTIHPLDATKDTKVTYLKVTVPTNDTSSGHISKPNDVPDDIPNKPIETPINPVIPSDESNKPQPKPDKITKPSNLQHAKNKNAKSQKLDLNADQNKPLVNTNIDKQISKVENHSVMIKPSTVMPVATIDTLPQTGTKSVNKLTALNMVALGFTLLSFGLVVKPKKKM